MSCVFCHDRSDPCLTGRGGRYPPVGAVDKDELVDSLDYRSDRLFQEMVVTVGDHVGANRTCTLAEQPSHFSVAGARARDVARGSPYVHRGEELGEWPRALDAALLGQGSPSKGAAKRAMAPLESPLRVMSAATNASSTEFRLPPHEGAETQSRGRDLHLLGREANTDPCVGFSIAAPCT